MMTILAINYVPWFIAYGKTCRPASRLEYGRPLYMVMAAICVLSFCVHYFNNNDVSVMLLLINYFLMLQAIIMLYNPKGFLDYLSYLIAGLVVCFSILMGSAMVSVLVWEEFLMEGAKA